MTIETQNKTDKSSEEQGARKSPVTRLATLAAMALSSCQGPPLHSSLSLPADSILLTAEEVPFAVQQSFFELCVDPRIEQLFDCNSQIPYHNENRMVKTRIFLESELDEITTKPFIKRVLDDPEQPLTRIVNWALSDENRPHIQFLSFFDSTCYKNESLDKIANTPHEYYIIPRLNNGTQLICRVTIASENDRAITPSRNLCNDIARNGAMLIIAAKEDQEKKGYHSLACTFTKGEFDALDL